MAKLLVTDELWSVIGPLFPGHTPSPKGGQPPIDDRVCLTGILFVLKTGIPWEDFPRELGCCGMTLWNRLRDWQASGVWQTVHTLLLAKLRGADMIDFSRAAVDPSSVRAVHGGKKRDPAPWTAPRGAPSTTWSPMPRACRWPAPSPAPTATT